MYVQPYSKDLLFSYVDASRSKLKSERILAFWASENVYIIGLDKDASKIISLWQILLDSQFCINFSVHTSYSLKVQ